MFTTSGNLFKTAIPKKYEESINEAVPIASSAVPLLLSEPCESIEIIKATLTASLRDELSVPLSPQATETVNVPFFPIAPVLPQIPETSSSNSLEEIGKVLTPKRKYECTSPIRKRQRTASPETPVSHLRSTPRTSRFVQKLINLPGKEEVNPNKYKRKSEQDTPKRQKLKDTIRDLQKALKNKELAIKRLKKKLQEKKKNVEKTFLSKLTKNSRTLVLMQLKGNNKKWTYQEKRFAMSIYYKSPSTYCSLRRNGIVLPGKSTVRRWLQSIFFKAGINNQFCEHLKIKAQTMTPMQKACVVMFDEMTIMKNLEYNKNIDVVEGFEDLGMELEGGGRRKYVGTHALVIMIRGLYHKWKIPFSYYIAGRGGVKAPDLKIILEKALNKIAEIGFIPKAVVCDQAPINGGVYRSIKDDMKNKELEIREDGKLRIGEQDVFWIWDVPHLMKSVRNNFLYEDFLIDGKTRISFQDIIKTYEIDCKSQTSRSMIKITPIHLNPNKFKRMSCKLALQIFSHSVAKAIKTAHDTKELKSDTALDTSSFISMMNSLFDTLNSRCLYDPNPYRRALSLNNMWHFEVIQNALNVFENLKKLAKKERPPCFEGMVTSLRSVLGLFEEERTNNDYKNNLKESSKSRDKSYFLLTSRLNQDPLENFFSVIRQKNGYNRNPTTKNFRCSFAHVSTFSFHKYTDLGNCDADEDFFLDLNFANNEEKVLEERDKENNQMNEKNDPEKTDQVNNDEPDAFHVMDLNIDSQTDAVETDENIEEIAICENIDEVMLEGISDEIEQYNLNPQPTLESCSNVFFAGHLVHWSKKYLKCADCDDFLNGQCGGVPEAHKLLIRNRNLPHVQPGHGLKEPTSLLVSVTILTLSICAHELQHDYEKKNLLHTIFSRAKEEIQIRFPHFFDGKCIEHRYSLMRYLIRTKLFKHCKLISKSFYSNTMNSKTPKPDPKLRILKGN